jgi:hypothetical protein
VAQVGSSGGISIQTLDPIKGREFYFGGGDDFMKLPVARILTSNGRIDG